MSIGRRLTVAFSLVCLLLVVVAAAGIVGSVTQQSLRRETAKLQSVRHTVETLHYRAADVSGWLGYMYADALVTDPATAYGPESAEVVGLADARKATYQLLQQADTGAFNAAERKEFAHTKQLWDTYFAVYDEMASKVRQSPRTAMPATWQTLNGELATAWTDLLTSTEKLSKSLDDRSAALAERSDRAAGLARTAVMLAALLAIAAAIVLGVVVTRSIVRPLRRSVHALTCVADGDLTASPGIAQHDEAGQLAAAFDTTMESLRGIVSTLAESAGTMAVTAAEMERTTSRISDSAAEASVRATEVSSAASVVSENVQTVAAASEEMGASISEIARSAQHAVGVADEAVREADATRRTIDQLGASSQEIGNVVKLDRRADEPARPERDDRGCPGRRGRQGVCRGRQRGQGPRAGDREGDRRHLSAGRCDPGRRLRRRRGDRPHQRGDQPDQRLPEHDRCRGRGAVGHHEGDEPQRLRRRRGDR
jgi:methyl-accepting chemotaxis protein